MEGASVSAIAVANCMVLQGVLVFLIKGIGAVYHKKVCVRELRCVLVCQDQCPLQEACHLHSPLYS